MTGCTAGGADGVSGPAPGVSGTPPGVSGAAPGVVTVLGPPVVGSWPRESSQE